MRPTLTSLRSPQGRPGPADTKHLPGRHPHVTHVADTPTMGRSSERLEVPFELMTTGQPRGGDLHRRRRVLVVADAADAAELIRDSLVTEAWEVFTTDSGADALKHVRDVRPDVVLLELGVPQLDCWQIYRQLKVDQETRAIPVIMVTGRVEEGDTVLPDAPTVGRVNERLEIPANSCRRGSPPNSRTGC